MATLVALSAPLDYQHVAGTESRQWATAVLLQLSEESGVPVMQVYAFMAACPWSCLTSPWVTIWSQPSQAVPEPRM